MANQKAGTDKPAVGKLTDAGKRALVLTGARHLLKEEVKAALSAAALADVRYVETEVDKADSRITLKVGLRGYYHDADRERAVATLKKIEGLTDVEIDDLGVVITGFRRVVVVTPDE